MQLIFGSVILQKFLSKTSCIKFRFGSLIQSETDYSKSINTIQSFKMVKVCIAGTLHKSLIQLSKKRFFRPFPFHIYIAASTFKDVLEIANILRQIKWSIRTRVDNFEPKKLHHPLCIMHNYTPLTQDIMRSQCIAAKQLTGCPQPQTAFLTWNRNYLYEIVEKIGKEEASVDEKR